MYVYIIIFFSIEANKHTTSRKFYSLWWLICAISYYRVFGAKRRHAKTRQMVTLSCFRKATFRLSTRKYDTFHASPFRPLFVVSLSGGAKGCHAKTHKNHHLAGYRVATFRPARRKTRHSMRCVFGYCLSYLCLAGLKVAMRKPAKITIWRVFAWRPFAYSPWKHDYTTWHKSARHPP